jgi:acyl-ACP thioesterase
VFRAQRRIRLSDTTADRRLRLDAAARYLQDVASDDVDDAGIDDGDSVWVVRRTVMDVIAPLRGDRAVELATWSAGIGRSWAARRTTIAGDAAGLIEAETTWVYVDSRTMRLERLPAAMLDVYREASGGRVASTKLTLSPQAPLHAKAGIWPLRVSDIDILGHVNNAVHWAALETALAERAPDVARLRGIMEYRQPIDLTQTLELRTETTPRGFRVWYLADGAAAATAEILALDAGG